MSCAYAFYLNSARAWLRRSTRKAARRGVHGSKPDKYDVKVPGGLAFSEFKGYEA